MHQEHFYFNDENVGQCVEIETTDSSFVDNKQADTPTKLDKATQTGNMFSEIQTQSSSILSSGCPRKQKLQTIIKEQKQQLKEMEKSSFTKSHLDSEKIISKDTFKGAGDINLPGNIAKLAKTMVDLKQSKPEGRRYSREFKQDALSIY